MASPLRDLVAQIRLKINSNDVKNVISAANTLKKKLSLNSSKISIELDKKSLSKTLDGIDKIKKDLNGISKNQLKVSNSDLKSLRNASNIIKGIALTSLSTKFISSIKNSIFELSNYSRSIETISQATGISNKTLESFSFLAEGIGVSAEQSRQSLVSFTRRIREAQRGSRDAAESFGLLRVNLFSSSGVAKTSSELFEETSRALAAIENPSERARLAIKVFGDGAGRLLPVLSGFEGSLDDAQNRLESFGSILSDNIKKDSNEFIRNVRNLNHIIFGFRNNLLGLILPVINRFIKTFNEFLVGNKDNIKSFAKSILNLGSAVATAIGLISVAKILSIVGSIKRLKDVLLAPLKASLFGLLVTAVDDVIRGFLGFDSITKDIIDSFNGKDLGNTTYGKSIKAITDTIHSAIDSYKELISLLSSDTPKNKTQKVIAEDFFLGSSSRLQSVKGEGVIGKIQSAIASISAFTGAGLSEQIKSSILNNNLNPALSGAISSPSGSSIINFNPSTDVKIDLNVSSTSNPTDILNLLKPEISNTISSSYKEALESLGIKKSK